MSSPTKEEGDPADDSPKYPEDEAPEDFTRDEEPTFAESDMIAQVKSSPVGLELDTANEQGPAALEPAENHEPEAEENKEDPQEDAEEDLQLTGLQVPSKEAVAMLAIGSGTPLGMPLANPSEANAIAPSPNTPSASAGNAQRAAGRIYYVNINYKIPFQFSLSWRMPFTNARERRRMFLRMVCEGYFSHFVGRRSARRGKPRFRALLLGSRAGRNGERTPPRRPLRVSFCDALCGAKAGRKAAAPAADKKETLPQTPFEDALHNKVSEDGLRVMIALTDDGWKYLCPICGATFDSVLELRIHCCRPLED